jgi:transposase
MYLRDKLSLHEITRRTGLSRNTIRRWLRDAEQVAPPKYRRNERPSRLSPFYATLEQALRADSHRPKQNRRTAKALFAQIKAEGYDGGYTGVTDFIRDWRGRDAKIPHAFIPLKFELGLPAYAGVASEALRQSGILGRCLPQPRPRDAL